MKGKTNIWAIVPAAGVGARMQTDRPKQYLSVGGKTILEHSLSALLEFDMVAGVQLCLSAQDGYWADIDFQHERLLPIVDGGERRADTVLAGLKALEKHVREDDWVMVHDAARPCITSALLTRLVDSVMESDVGGILATPVADTLKQTEQGGVIHKTIDREMLWSAQTPQMFRYALLVNCLEKALADNLQITDEASALEASGYQPMLVPSSRHNIKVTYPEDIAWVEYILA